VLTLLQAKSKLVLTSYSKHTAWADKSLFAHAWLSIAFPKAQTNPTCSSSLNRFMIFFNNASKTHVANYIG